MACAAAVLAGVVLRGEMGAQGVWDAHILDPNTSRLVLVRHRPLLLLRWLLRYHSQAVWSPGSCFSQRLKA